MDPTQRFDPNRTQIGVPPAADLNRTQAIGDLGRTMAMRDPLGDFGKTQAMPAGGGGAPGISFELVPGREAAMANGAAREQYLLKILAGGSGGGFSGGVRTPLNLCLVLDRSGSMEGPPLEYAKQACAFVVDMLGPDDVLSIVTFEETADVLMAPQRVTAKDPIKQGIARLMPGNTTNLYDGVSFAAQQVAQAEAPGRATRIVVLSDGDPTAGIKDFPSLTGLAADLKTKGITATFLGFGPDYNEELLAAMAKRAGGNYYYIPQPQMIPDVFRTELDRVMSVGYRNLRLRVKPARWVRMRAPQAADEKQEISLDLADLERGSSIEQVFDFEFANHPLGWYRVAAGKLTFDDLAGGAGQSVDVDFVMEFTSDAARYSAPQDPRVAASAQTALVSRQIERTVMGLKTGAITQAIAVQDLQKTQALLLQDGRAGEAREVTMALQALQSGNASGAEKTLMGTILNLDQGKR